MARLFSGIHVLLMLHVRKSHVFYYQKLIERYGECKFSVTTIQLWPPFGVAQNVNPAFVQTVSAKELWTIMAKKRLIFSVISAMWP